MTKRMMMTYDASYDESYDELYDDDVCVVRCSVNCCMATHLLAPSHSRPADAQTQQHRPRQSPCPPSPSYGTVPCPTLCVSRSVGPLSTSAPPGPAPPPASPGTSSTAAAGSGSGSGAPAAPPAAAAAGAAVAEMASSSWWTARPGVVMPECWTEDLAPPVDEQRERGEAKHECWA